MYTSPSSQESRPPTDFCRGSTRVSAIARRPGMGIALPSHDPKLAGLRKWRVNEFEKFLIFYVPLSKMCSSSPPIQSLIVYSPSSNQPSSPETPRKRHLAGLKEQARLEFLARTNVIGNQITGKLRQADPSNSVRYFGASATAFAMNSACAASSSLGAGVVRVATGAPTSRKNSS